MIRPFLITVHPDDTFRKLLELITEHWVHRVYICAAGATSHLNLSRLLSLKPFNHPT